MSDAPSPARPRCPICGRPSLAAMQPFCSARCARVDLGRWFGEGYRVASSDEAAGDDVDDGEAG